MNVTNKSSKIIGIGELALVPGETKPLPYGFEDSPIVLFLVKRGKLSLDGKTKEKAAAEQKAKDEAEAAAKDAEEKAKAEAEANEKAAAEQKAKDSKNPK